MLSASLPCKAVSLVLIAEIQKWHSYGADDDVQQLRG